MANKLPELLPCPFCGRDAWYQYSPPMVKCSVCPARSWDCGSRSEAYAAWNTRAETRPTPPADAMPNDLDGTEYEWKLAVPEEDAVKRPLQEAIDYKWHHVLNANGGYKFEEFSKETWGALPIGVIETLRIAAIRYRALQSPAPVTDAHGAADSAARKALEEFPEGRNHGDLCRYLDKHEGTIRAALTSPAQAQVDVEKLKREIIAEWNAVLEADPQYKFHQPSPAQTIAIAIHYLCVKGHLTPKTQSEE